VMHMLGDPRTMQDDPHYDDVVNDIRAFLEGRLEFAISRGIERARVMLDPGIGFGKTVAHNLELLQRLDELVAIGQPLGARNVCVVVKSNNSGYAPGDLLVMQGLWAEYMISDGKAAVSGVHGLLRTARGDDPGEVRQGIEGESDRDDVRRIVRPKRGQHGEMTFGQERQRVVGEPRSCLRHRYPN